MEQYINYHQVIEQGMPFEDAEFPSNLQALFDPDDFTENANVQLFTDIEFKRASDIFGEGNFDILPPVIEPSSII